MSETPRLPWNAPALEESLRAVLPGIEVQVSARCDSTNTRLLERARAAGGAMPCLLVAEHQTQGRGRLGRSWAAAPGASLTFSLALALAPRDWSGLSLAAGLSLAEALEPAPAAGAPRLALKWPNDLWLADEAPRTPRSGRKLAGILVETVSVGSRRWCVVGVGINVAPLDPVADGGAGAVACLQELRPHASAPQVLAEVALPLARALLAFEREGFAPLVTRYAARDLLRGQVVRAGAQGAASEAAIKGAIEGVSEGLDAQGALLLRAGERLERIVSGEVSVRLSQARADEPLDAAPREGERPRTEPRTSTPAVCGP